MQIELKAGAFELVNEEKVNRAINGMITRGGELKGGVGEKAEPEEIVAEYDRLGGLVKRVEDGAIVKTGAFYDFAKKAARKDFKIVYVFSINGRTIEVEDGEKLPLEVRAAQEAEKGDAEAAADKPKKPKKSTTGGVRSTRKKLKDDGSEEEVE